jgi:flagellar export protein FliJ
MAHFRFRLAPVLQLRQRRDDEAQRALAQAERRLHDAERRQQDASARLESAYQAAGDAERQSADVAMLGWHRNWILARTRAVDATRLAIQDCQDVMHVATREAQEARRDVRVLQKFEDRARAAFNLEQARLEMKAIDELATLQAARRLGDAP